MNRRSFINTSLTAGVGLSVLPELTGQKLIQSLRDVPENNEILHGKWIIHDNGTFDLEMGHIALKNCRPGFDGQSVFPEKVAVEKYSGGGKIVYTTNQGHIILDFRSTGNYCSLKATLKGYEEAPHWFYPIFQGEISGGEYFYKQGLGFGGPSGIYPFPQGSKKEWGNVAGEQAWSYDSFLTTGISGYENDFLATGALRHDEYLHRSTLYNRQHREGLVDRHVGSDIPYFETGFSLERIPLGDDKLHLPEIIFRGGTNPFSTLRELVIMMHQAAGAKKLRPPRYHWCSWYEYEKQYNYERLTNLLNGLREIKPELPLQTIQIDDGYCILGDWLDIDKDKWPEGLDQAVEDINKEGFEAGIWVGPFMVSSKSKIYKNHRDWLIKNYNNEPIPEWENDGENVFALDTSHPEAFKYLRKVFQTLYKMGFRYFKTDFMDWGLKDSTKVKRAVPGQTSVQYFCDVANMIRKEIKDSFWLGCIAPFQPLIGQVDGIRIANDATPKWTTNTENMLGESLHDQYFNNVLWQNDPDVVFVREHDNAMTEEEIFSTAVWIGMLGGVVNTSDRLQNIPVKRLKLFRFIQPSENHQTATFPRWTSRKGLVSMIRKYKHGWAFLVLNPTENTQSDRYNTADLFYASSLYTYDWKPQEFNGLGQLSEINVELQPHQAKLFYLTNNNNTPNANMGLNGNLLKF